MTVLAGVLAEDGAVIAADTLMSTEDLRGLRVAGHLTNKIVVILDGLVVMAHTGETGAGARICEAVAKHYKVGGKDPKVAALAPHEYAKWLFQPVRNAAVADEVMMNQLVARAGKVPQPDGDQAAFVFSRMIRQRIGGGFALLPRDGMAMLARFEGTDTSELHRADVEFAFLGSGHKEAEIFFHFLRGLLFPGRLPTLAEAELAAYWSIQHCIDVDAHGVGGKPKLATLRHGDTVPVVLNEDELSHHAALVKELRDGFTQQVTQAIAAKPTSNPLETVTGTLPDAVR